MNAVHKENPVSSANRAEEETRDDFELESEEEIAPALEKFLESAWNKIEKLVEKQIPDNFTIFEVERPYSKHTKPEDITMEYFMKIKHLIIPKNVANYAMEFSNQICEFKWNYEYGDTHCNNLVWRQFMYPEMKKIQTMLKKKNWHDAFGSLFGIYLFDRKDGGHWIHDQEEYDDMTNFSAWFRKYCSSWKKLLEQSDEEIGLICKGGLPTGYRETLMYILQR